MDFSHAYWLYAALAEVVESHYADFIQQDLDYQKDLASWTRQQVHKADIRVNELNGQNLSSFLTEVNHEIVKHCNEKTRELIFSLITQGCELSKLRFKMDPNL